MKLKQNEEGKKKKKTHQICSETGYKQWRYSYQQNYAKET